MAKKKLNKHDQKKLRKKNEALSEKWTNEKAIKLNRSRFMHRFRVYCESSRAITGEVPARHIQITL